MDSKRILNFLRQIAANNNRPWFQDHKAEYDVCKAEFERGISQAIAVLAEFDSEISHVTPKDTTYRFYRDVRFSEDKSPYKRHFGAYICAKGKKALRGGYYIHLQPGQCVLAIGSYWLPTKILTSCRNEIMGNTAEWLKCVANGKFVKTFGYPNETEWGDVPAPKGFGISCLKTAPKGFPRDYEYIDYLRMKDYCCWKKVDDSFFEGENWLEGMAETFKTAKPMMDFMNSVIDDYE